MRGKLWLGVVCSLVVLVPAAAAGFARAASPAPATSPSAAAASPSAAVASPSAVTGDPVATSRAAGPDALVAVDGIPFRFRADSFTLRDLPIEERPGSSNHVMSKSDSGLHDAQGVRMHRIGGKLYDFPRGQANFGIANLDSYRISGDQFYLDRALAQADRMVSYHTEADGAWYFPTWPSRMRHGRTGEYIPAPYYSALTGGRILMFFSRLAEVTGSRKWREAADHAFLAFLRPGPRRGPYVLDVDRAGYYWLEEWPWGGMRPDHTFNGHNTASYGLYEYYQVTRDERAKALFRGALTTVKHYLPALRRPGWISCYCLEHRSVDRRYHGMHIGQLLQLYHMTGDLVFARASDAFMSDYPRLSVHGRLRVEPGACQAVKVTSGGAVVARRTFRVRHQATWKTGARTRLWPRSAIFIHADSGPAAGWWLQERRGRVFLLGTAEAQAYDPPRRLVIAAHLSLLAIKFDDEGGMTANVPVESGEGLRLSVDARARIDGSSRVRVTGGELDGYWIQLQRGVRLD